MKLQILTLPDPSLTTICAPAPVDRFTRALASDMRETIRVTGLGLAAPQVGHQIRLFVVNVGKLGLPYFAFFNPLITWASPDQEWGDEGCLSDPGTVKSNLRIRRHKTIEVQFTNRSGELMTQRFEGLQARVLQHEIDHLDGINIRDRVASQRG